MKKFLNESIYNFVQNDKYCVFSSKWHLTERKQADTGFWIKTQTVQSCLMWIQISKHQLKQELQQFPCREMVRSLYAQISLAYECDSGGNQMMFSQWWCILINEIMDVEPLNFHHQSDSVSREYIQENTQSFELWKETLMHSPVGVGKGCQQCVGGIVFVCLHMSFWKNVGITMWWMYWII